MLTRALNWQRTDLASRRGEDYTGLDATRPHLFARVYLSSKFDADVPWCWVLSENAPIATGCELELDVAIDAAERAFALWRNTKTPQPI